MGNHVGVPVDTPDLDVIVSGKFPLRTKVKNENGRFLACIHLWAFYERQDGSVGSNPVRLLDDPDLDPKSSYICVLTENLDEKDRSNKRTKKETEDKDLLPSTTFSLGGFLNSWDRCLTPRGITNCFGSLSFEPFLEKNRSAYRHIVYLWNGKDSSDIVRAITLAKAFEVEQVITSRLYGNVFKRLFVYGSMVVCKWT